VLLLLLCGFLIAAAIVATTSLLLSSLASRRWSTRTGTAEHHAGVAAHLDGVFGTVTGIQANLNRPDRPARL